jgi:hypothetical protein
LLLLLLRHCCTRLIEIIFLFRQTICYIRDIRSSRVDVIEEREHINKEINQTPATINSRLK